jgi:hypothetical protein
MDESGYVLHEHLNSHGSAVVAIQTTLGTNAGTSVLKDFTAGEFAVARNAGGTLRDTITFGTFNNAVLGTPTVSGGTFNAGVLGTPAITGGTYTSPVLAGTPVLDGTSAIPFYNDSMARQAIINGNFDVWQRGVTNTYTTDIYTYQADRWIFGATKDSGTLPTIVVSRQAITPGEINNSFYHFRGNVDGAGSGLGNSSECMIDQKIEYGTRFLCGDSKKVTTSFYARSSIANKKLGVYLIQSYGTGGTPTSAENITGTNWTLTSSWTKYTATFTTNTLASKTFGTVNDDYLLTRFYLQWGSSNASKVGAAGAETYVGSGNIDIAQVQLCAGSIALPFQPKNYGQELESCQRYYQKYGGSNTYDAYAVGGYSAGTISYNLINFVTTMRTKPTLTTSGTAANYCLFAYQTSADITLSAAPSISLTQMVNNQSALLLSEVATGGTAGQATLLRNNNTADGFLAFSADL